VSRLRQFTTAAPLLVAALVHLLPLPGLLGAAQLQSLYGLGALDADLELLLRHRALVFGLMGVALLLAVWRPKLRAQAAAFVLASDLGFALLALTHPALQPPLQRVLAFDLASIACLLLAWRLGRPQTRDWSSG
jgi:hypothetical protein